MGTQEGPAAVAPQHAQEQFEAKKNTLFEGITTALQEIEQQGDRRNEISFRIRGYLDHERGWSWSVDQAGKTYAEGNVDIRFAAAAMYPGYVFMKSAGEVMSTASGLKLDDGGGGRR